MKHLSLALFLATLCLGRAAAASSARHSSNTSLAMPCGNARMILQCTGNCDKTALLLKSSGNTLDITPPKGLERYTAVGLACAKASDGAPYFVVQYGQLPEGCAFCEWFHLYDTQGHLLTHSEPAVLTDATLPEGNQQFPNNKEFNILDRKLGLGRPNIQFISAH